MMITNNNSNTHELIGRYLLGKFFFVIFPYAYIITYFPIISIGKRRGKHTDHLVNILSMIKIYNYSYTKPYCNRVKCLGRIYIILYDIEA